MDLSPYYPGSHSNATSTILSHLYLTTNTSFPLQVYILSGLFAFLLVIQLISIAIRIKNGTWWVFKLVRGPVEGRTRFIVPNAIILYSISSAIFLIVLQKFLYEIINCSTIGSNIKNTMLSRCLTFIPLFNSGWSFVWATSITPILQPFILKRDVTFLSQHPLFINIFFLSVPLIVLAILLGLTIDLNARFNQAYNIYLTIVQLTEQKSSDITLIKSLELQIYDSLILSSNAWDRVFQTYYIITIFLIIIFVSAAIVHIRVLGTALRSHQTTNLRSSRRNHEFNSLVWAYRTLVFTCLAIISIAVVYLVVAVLVTLEPTKKNVSSVWLNEEFIILGATYCYLVFGGSAIIAIFIRSFVKPSSCCDFSTRSLSLPVEEVEDIVGGSRNVQKLSPLDFDMEEKGDLGSRTNLCE